MRSYALILFFTLAASVQAPAQPAVFQITLEPLIIKGLKGLQSYSYGQADGKWLIVGGRTDGLHRRQPFGAFSADGKNTELIVVDPLNMKKWKVSLATLSSDLIDQLSSSNMQFLQQGKYLFIIGGYGYSDGLKKFTTYDKLTVVDVPNTINAIINKTAINPYFRQISDTSFAVTGGHLKIINETYYLLGGQKFIGRYNPMGSDHGPGFFQQYTNQVRKFKLLDDGINMELKSYQVLTDSLAFHRRDYNVVPQILSNGKEGVTLFSGVFQTTANIPFINSVTIESENYKIDNSFAQYYNHYHSATLPLFSLKNNEMHNIFFGGIAQYYDSAGVLTQNDEVPFTKTIARVTRDKTGKLAEYKMPIEMQSLMGAGAEFIPLPIIPKYANSVIKLDEIKTETTLLGHIYGGIASTAPNVFWRNTGGESKANNILYKVYLTKVNTPNGDLLNAQSNNGLQLQVFPNVIDKLFFISFSLSEKTQVELEIKDKNGKLVIKEFLEELTVGRNLFSKNIISMKAGDTYWVTIKTLYAKSVQKIIIEP